MLREDAVYRRQGAALILAIVISAACAYVALGLSNAVRTSVLIAHNEANAAAAYMSAMGGLALLEASLVEHINAQSGDISAKPAIRPGAPHELPVPDGILYVQFSDARSLLTVPTDDLTLVENLADQLPLAAADKALLLKMAKTKPQISVKQLQQASNNPKLATAVGFLTTVGSAAINPLTAPRAVLQTIPNLSAPAIEKIISLRAVSGVEAERLVQIADLAARPWLTSEGGQFYQLEAVARLQSGAGFGARRLLQVKLENETQLRFQRIWTYEVDPWNSALTIQQ